MSRMEICKQIGKLPSQFSPRHHQRHPKKLVPILESTEQTRDLLVKARDPSTHECNPWQEIDRSIFKHQQILLLIFTIFNCSTFISINDLKYYKFSLRINFTDSDTIPSYFKNVTNTILVDDCMSRTNTKKMNRWISINWYVERWQRWFSLIKSSFTFLLTFLE